MQWKLQWMQIFPKPFFLSKSNIEASWARAFFRSCHPIFFDPISFILWLEIKYIFSYNSWPKWLELTSSKFETVLLKSQRGRKAWTWKTIHQEFWGMPWKQPHWELWNEPPLDMSQLTPGIPFIASLWIRSGYDMKVEVSAETYQVGAHFKALIKAILVTPLKSFESFFCISSSPAGLWAPRDCDITQGTSVW